MAHISHHKLGIYLLRFGLVAVYIYFGISQLIDPVSWSGIVPAWATLGLIDPVTIVYGNAVFEIIFAGLLAFGVWTKWVSILLGIHLGVITLTLGLTPAGVRDFGLTLATFAHGLMDSDK
jgi:uncharacterized membrane protein YphA (DoxX/SURF4 family)